MQLTYKNFILLCTVLGLGYHQCVSKCLNQYEMFWQFQKCNELNLTHSFDTLLYSHLKLSPPPPLGLMIRTQALRMEMWATERDVLRKLDFHSIYFCSSRLFRVGGHYSRLPFDGSLEEPIKHNKEQFLRIPEIPSKKTPKRSR